MENKIRVRQMAAYTHNGKVGKWMLWAAFKSSIDAANFADKLRLAHISWDVQVIRNDEQA